MTGLVILLIAIACIVVVFELISLHKRSLEDKGEY